MTKEEEQWHDCMQHAFEEAASGVENWEYGGAESKEEFAMTRKAAKEVAKIIRSVAKRRDKKFYLGKQYERLY